MSHDPCLKISPVLSPDHTLETGCIVDIPLMVTCVFRVGCFSQIGESIVRHIGVYMIDDIDG